MDKADREFLLAKGYRQVSDIKDAIFQGMVKDLHIDIYKDKPFMLLARVKEKNAVIAVDNTWAQNERLIITQIDNLKTHLFSVPLALITNTFMENGKNMRTILFNVKGDNYTYKICY